MYKLFPILLFAYGLAITTDDIYDNSWALIIGIDKYQNVQNLNYAVKDAESIQDILVNSFNFPEGNITLLKNEEANKDAILKAFSDLTIKAEYNDRVLIYFAGHGETMDLTEGGERGYLLPVDGDRKNLYLSSIGMDELEKISEMSKAKHMLYLVDACYGGIAAVGSRGLPDSTTPDFIEKITRNRAVQIITAGGRGEQVIEKSKWGHSAFTLNLKRGLGDGNADMNGDGYITANELGMFLREKVTIDSENQQTPQYGRMTSHEGEFIFINQNKLTPRITPSPKFKQNNNGKDYTLSQLGILEDNKISILEWSKYKEKGVSFDNFINYKHEIKYKSKALVRSIILPGWGQYYTENTARGLIYSSSFIFGVINIVCSPNLLNKPPFNDPITGKILFLYTSIISYGIAPLDAIVSVNIYNRELQKKYNIGFTPFHHYNQVSVILSYTF